MKSKPLDNVELQPITPKDEAFLLQLYATTREREMALVNWSEEEKASFLTMQFEAQHRFYQETFADAKFDIILVNGKPAGRLYVQHRQDEIRIIDIALLPEYRNHGIGSSLMRQILEEGSRRGLPVRIHVERTNPAMNLYRRLGFRKIDDHGVYDLMAWAPSAKGQDNARPLQDDRF